MKLAISGYDAAYIALAEALETELWTGDRKLFEKVRDRTESVRWIGDYAP
jgi:predicted nucleic acid-binding protein